MWPNRHQNPVALSADDEFNRHPFRRALQKKEYVSNHAQKEDTKIQVRLSVKWDN